jgi:hypothetical protein
VSKVLFNGQNLATLELRDMRRKLPPLLRARGERHARRRADQRNELASLHR